MAPKTVYLLDDEKALVDLHSEIVEMAGLLPKSFTRASEFFEQVKEFENDSILVLDLHMPEIDGIEVMRRLAKNPNPPSLMLISGRDPGVLSSAEKLCRAHGLEILASMSKPVSLDYFKALLEQHVPTARRNEISGVPDVDDDFNVAELQQAIRQEQMMLYFQPQYDISTGQLHGVEALVRWQHPVLGLINIEKIIPFAEKHGLIGEITQWVIDRAVNQQLQWQQAGFDLSVSVNISAVDITSLVLPEQLVELLEDHKLDPTRFTLEITESALLGELVTSLDILTRLRLKGFGLSIDDFGIGYSSLTQLHRVPFTELKIDRSFVSSMTIDDEARSIVKTCIMLGHELNMSVVAEGVETELHYQLLKEMSCDIAQGYFLSKPLSSEDMTSRLDAGFQTIYSMQSDLTQAG